MTASDFRITRLGLSNFRNYAEAELFCDAPFIALVGRNGSGKTNILEALSLFAPGRGFRRAAFTQMNNRAASSPFAINLDLRRSEGETVHLGTGLLADSEKRQFRIDRDEVRSARFFHEYMRVLWLIPEQDAFFRDSPSVRRRFLDRLVLLHDLDHAGRVNSLEKALRDRNRLLEENSDKPWLDAIECHLARLAVSVAVARLRTILLLREVIAKDQKRRTFFPWAKVALHGELETRLESDSSENVAAFYRDKLVVSRPRDCAAKRTLSGPHLSDFFVEHGPQGVAAAQTSTGEQKALLIGLVLACAQLARDVSGHAPILLLDELAAHLDSARRAEIFALLCDFGAQVWVTGADAAYLEGAPSFAARFLVSEGAIQPLKN